MYRADRNVVTAVDVSVGAGKELAERAKAAGAAVLPGTAEVEPEPVRRKLLSSAAEEGANGGPKSSKPVHLIKNVQPLPRKTVEAIQEGAFVEFAYFPVLEEGPVDGEGRDGQGDSGEGNGSSRKKKERREVPDILWWSTCFSLYQAAWATKEPKMWLPLSAYREVIFRLARRHPWALVAKYDRRFRQEAAALESPKWEKEKMTLIWEIMPPSGQSKGEGRGYGAGGDVSSKRNEPRKKGYCFRFNKEGGNCVFGQQCRFGHSCAKCGGDHPRYRCKGLEKTTD